MPLAASRRKFAEMILYVARETEGDRRCGATKLNKILFYADFGAFRKLGRSISGQEYQKLERGPAPRALLPVVGDLEVEGACVWAERNYLGFQQKKLLARREPDLSLFSAEEIDILRSVIDELSDLSATEVSDLSHNFLGWQAAQLGETIPYGTALIEPSRPLTDEEQDYAAAVAREFLAETANDRQTAPLRAGDPGDLQGFPAG